MRSSHTEKRETLGKEVPGCCFQGDKDLFGSSPRSNRAPSGMHRTASKASRCLGVIGGAFGTCRPTRPRRVGRGRYSAVNLGSLWSRLTPPKVTRAMMVAKTWTIRVWKCSSPVNNNLVVKPWRLKSSPVSNLT